MKKQPTSLSTPHVATPSLDGRGDEQDRSRSQYLYELIQKARAKRQGQLSSKSFDAAPVEELEGTIEQLEALFSQQHLDRSDGQTRIEA